ncbi:class I adenylate-forming enzyme family protein [Paenibacillus eucommiae]|uniref:Fatty-acyl-CoA synthase n=1 Tax=Paenibacillus eucommiae TaxID=1355755 RepID=A0ABS4IXP9_9BACL|nr:class I adenylate-forming enzyme family protein [Paenibacillus eucommiae]MBP1991771.1 fatty-acyl-CoA synthase [Paenibacillus eucommiae]
MKYIKDLNKDTIPYLLLKRAAYSPHDIAYSFPELQQNYSWSTIWHDVRLLAKGFLQLGITKGNSIALLMPGRMELILSMFAAACVGAIVVPLNTYSKKHELQIYLKDSRPTAMIIGTEGHHLHYPSLLEDIISESKLSGDSSWVPANIFVLEDKAKVFAPFRPFEELARLGERGADQDFLSACQSVCSKDPLILLYTSGTLGTPKGVLRSTASFVVSPSAAGSRGKGASIMQRMTDRITRYFSIMNLLPLYHMGGFSTIFTALKVCNVRIVMLTHFNPLKSLAVIDKMKCKVLVGTPFMIQHMLSSPKRNQFDLTSLLGVAFTSAAVNNSILQKVTKDLNLYFFMVSYGSSEAGAVANGTCFMDRKNNLMVSLLYKLLKRVNLLSGLIQQKDFEHGSYSLAGKLDKGVEVRILDPETEEPLPLYEHGEIVIRSHRVMRYTKENQGKPSFTKDGWYKSGDLGFLDERRHLTITGRLHRLISRGGEKISPVEIENVLLCHKDVEEAIVFGIPDELYGEQICACIVTKDEAALNAEKLKNDMTPFLSAFKIPRYVVFLPYFPLSPTGKISIAELQLLALDRIGELRKNA